MFEAHKKKKAAETARAAEQAAQIQKAANLEEWNYELMDLQGLLNVVSGHSAGGVTELILKPGEIGVAQITNVGLIEDRKGAGEWKGASQGVSFPISHIAGRPIRYRVGQTHGHYVQGEPVPTAVDTGTFTITSQRMVYQGSKKSLECTFAKLLGIHHGAGGLTISVSNRQKPMTVHYGERLDDWVATRLTIALALFHGEASDAVAQLQAQISELEAHKPTD